MSQFGSMSVEAYIGQGVFYFSESQQEQVLISGMVPHYAFNAYKKLLAELGDDFPESDLGVALANRFIPDTDTLRGQMATHGKAMIRAEVGVNTARSRLRRAGAKVTRREGEWVAGYPAQIKVNLHAH